MTHDELKNLLEQAYTYNNTGNCDEAEHLAQIVLDNTRTANVDDRDVMELHISAILSLFTSAWFKADYKQALILGTSALELTTEHHFPFLHARALSNIGAVYLNLADYSKALEYMSLSLSAYQNLGEQSLVALVAGNIGVAYLQLGDYTKALEYYSKALASFQGLGEQSGVANVMGNIGLVYVNLGDYTKALEYMSRALSAHQDLGEHSHAAQVLGNIGGVFHSIGDYTKALEYYNRALATHEDLGDQSAIALITANIGSGYKDLGDYNKALEHYNKALAIHQALGTQLGVATVTGNIGGLYALKEYDDHDATKAEEYLLKAIAISTEIGAKAITFEFHKTLSELYEYEERWKESKECFVRFHNLKEEVHSEEATKQAQVMEHRRKVEDAERDRQVKLARFQEQEKILHNILPSQIADRILEGEKTIADRHQNVSVFFSDIVGFTKLSQSISADELVGLLNGIFSEFDRIARKHRLEKIKTIGDAYMAVAGAPIEQNDHAERAALFALEIVEAMKSYRRKTNTDIQIRIGLHSGSVVAGIIGENKFSYDLWGDTVNTASRMESHSEAGKIHVSEEFVRNLTPTLSKGEGSQDSFSFPFGEGKDGVLVERGEMDIKGKGIMKTYFLERLDDNG